MKTNHRLFSHAFLLLLSFCTFSAGSSLNASSFVKRTSSSFARQWSLTQPEKAYLHLDKPYYSVGEKIWFKGYVVNAVTHVPKSMSRFLYVELLDRSGDVIERVKVKKDSIGFSGYLKLNTDLQAGSYQVRAYTYWMLNSGIDYFFRKDIYVGNSIDDKVVTSIDYSEPKGGKCSATILFQDPGKNPLAGKSVDVLQSWNNPHSKKQTYVTGRNGKITIPMQLDSVLCKTRMLDVSISDPALKYKKRFFLPEFRKDFDVQFFPESGDFLSGQMQMVGFKAIGADGLGVSVSGTIYNSKGEELTDFQSLHMGMGRFTMQVDSADNCYAVVKSETGLTKRINLPKVVGVGAVLHLVYNRGKVLYEVVNKTNRSDGALCLMLHQRGKLLALMPLKDLQGQISEDLLPPGIISMAVVDTLGTTYSERLYFVRDNHPISVSMTTDKSSYGKREPVHLALKVSSAEGLSGAGDFSLAVTDKVLIKPDTLAGNIMTNFLLTSDLKGYVESPASYFTGNVLLDKERLDVLMLTQGWRRFSTAEVLKGRVSEPKYFMEAGQALSGKVLNLFNKPSKKCRVIMISAQTGKIKMVQTDSLGRYLMDGIDFPDSTSFVLKATKDKSFGDVELVPDKDEFAPAETFIPYQNQSEQAVSSDFLWQSKQKYYMEGGMRMVNLDGVTVSAKKIDPNSTEHFYSGMEDRKIDEKKLEQFPGMGVLELLSMEPGVQVVGDDVTIRGAKDGPVFFVDEVEAMSIDEVKYLNSSDIQEISIFKGASASIFGSRGGNGVIAISLKKGVVRKAETPPSLVTVTPLGYQKPEAFYMPKYDVDSELKNPKADLRTTIYWAPELKPDADGVIHVTFFTADKANNYHLTLEGVSEKGQVCRFVGDLIRKGE